MVAIEEFTVVLQRAKMSGEIYKSKDSTLDWDLGQTVLTLQ